MNFEAASALVSALETGITKTIFEPRKARISMLRAARIKAAGIEYPAVIRNISSTGMMAAVDAPLELGMEISLALANRSEEHTSALQSLMHTSYADFCLKNKHKTATQLH